MFINANLVKLDMKMTTFNLRTKIANDIMYYIYTNIDTNIDIEELSYDMDISKFHMHRIFKEIFGKNIYETIKSIRLQKAASLLLTNKYSTISDIAHLCGYSSHSSFIKAFRTRFTMSPKEWKSDGYKIYSKNILHQSKSAINSRAKFNHLSPSIVKMPEIDSFYIRNQGYNVNIKETWQKLQTWVLSNDIKDYRQIALLHDNPIITPLNECQYIACINVRNTNIVSDKLPKFSISDGVYARFDFQGKHGDMLKFIYWVYYKWLIKNGYEATTKPSYVIYNKNNFLSKDNEFDVSFYVSISF